jgi:hypothetical protein
MKIFPLLADAAHAGTAGNFSVLNAGWCYTTAIKLAAPEGGWTLPAQGLVIVVEADWSDLNKTHPVTATLVDEDSNCVDLRNESKLVPAVIKATVNVPSTPGAPNGTPGRGHLIFSLGAGSIHLAHAPCRLTWKVTVGAIEEALSFWVNVPAPPVEVG